MAGQVPVIDTVRALPREKAEQRYDLLMREQGVIRSDLTGDAAKAYDQGKEANVQTCVALHESPEKQEKLKRRAQAVDRWAEQEAAKGRWHWGTEVPEHVYEPAARPREAAARSSSSPDSGASRQGDSGDRPRPSGSELARRQRASRRGGLR